VTLGRGYVSGVSKDRTVCIRGGTVREIFLYELPLGLPGSGDVGAAVFLTAGRLCNIKGLIQ
jgi:hypothetical protein